MLQFLHVSNVCVFTDIKVYQEKAVKDKERYKAEMEDYRERLKMGHVISDAVPLQQRLPEADSGLVDVEIKMLGSPQTPEVSSSGGSDYDDDTNMGASPPGAGAEATTYVGSEKPSRVRDFEQFLHHCEGEGDALVQQTPKMNNESKNMLALI